MSRYALLLSTMAWLLCPTLTQADLFDTARRSIHSQMGVNDYSGVTMQGGAALQSGVSPGALTIFRGQSNIGGPCGSFNFAASFKEAVEEIPDLLEAVAQQLAANVPMLVLCYSSPTICDITKHVQGILNALVQARMADCQAVQNAMAYGGLRMRGGQISQCLEDQVNSGATLNAALRTCHGDVGGIRSPLGTNNGQVNLVQETLQAAGASPELQTLAKGLVGDITLRANGSQLATDHQRPQASLLSQYETNRAAADAALRAAIDELAANGTVSDQTMQSISVPGQVTPRAALDALLTLRNDPVRYESFVAKLSTGIGLTQLQWACSELEDALASAMEANTHLTDEERRLLERRLQGLEHEMKQVLAKKKVVDETLQPTVDALLREYAGVQQMATQAGFRAPATIVPAMPYRTQMPIGYGR